MMGRRVPRRHPAHFAVGAHARLAVAFAAAAAVLTAVGSAGSAGSAVSDVTAVVTRIDPSSLARGADPSVVHMVRDTIRDGDRRVRATRWGGHDALWAVPGGYLLRDIYVGPRQLVRVVFVDPAGERRVVAWSRDWIDVAVSADGTRVALGESSGWTGMRRVVTVLRTQDGRVLARRELRLARVVAVTRRAVLLGRGLGARSSTTQWWNHRRDRLRTIHDAKALRADVPHDRVVFEAGREDSFCNRVALLSRPDRTLWRSCRFYPHQWSPDGRRVLATYTYFDAAGTARWWLVDGRTGSREARFVGRLDWDAVWEDDQHFLTAAQGEDGKAALVRCDVAGACERASRLWDVPVPPDPSMFYAAPPVLLAEE
jgi:hypothetical protein